MLACSCYFNIAVNAKIANVTGNQLGDVTHLINGKLYEWGNHAGILNG
jgi:hypothetical protein